MKRKISQALNSKGVLLSDGAWGTALQALGLKGGQCGEMWCTIKRHVILGIAKSYIDAGSDIILTNSFGATSIKLAHYDLEDRAEKINRAAAQISREVAGDDRLVFGSVGPTGKIIMMGDVTEDELYESFAEQVVGLEKGGADGILIETMSAIDEAAIAIRAAKENTVLEVGCTFTFERAGYGGYHTIMGHTIADYVDAMRDASVDYIGTNCGNGIDEITEIVRQMREIEPQLPIIAQPNAGKPEIVGGEIVYRETPEMMAAKVPELIEAGANIVGGCCGTTPEHVKAMSGVLASM